MTKEEILGMPHFASDFGNATIVVKWRTALEAMQEYATQEKQGWVKCSERLPEGFTSFKTMSDYVQVYCGLKGADYAGTGRYCHDRKKWYALSFNGLQCGEWVSHWMPLPQKPEV